MSKVTYGNKLQEEIFRSLITHTSGGLGIILYPICLIPLIYLVNKKPGVITIMNLKILPMAILRTIQIVLSTLYLAILPLQIPYLPDGGYVSGDVCFINDLRSIKKREERKNINTNS